MTEEMTKEMTKEITIDYLCNISIPQFKVEIDILRRKHGYPQKILGDPEVPLERLPVVTNGFHKDVIILKNTIIEFLKQEFPIEINNNELFNDSLKRNIKYNYHYPQGARCTSIESYVAWFCTPSCIGIPLDRNYGDTCRCTQPDIRDKIKNIEVNGIVNALSLAYKICTEAKKIRIDKDAAALREKQRIEKEKYEKLLCESLSMHYFPERIENGVRRPPEWLPDFNLDLIKEISATFCSSVAHEIVKKAIIVTKPIKDQMIAKYKQDEEKIQEESKARVLARAIVLANALAESDNISSSASVAGDPQ